MKIANYDNRPHLVTPDEAAVIDLAEVLGDRFASFVQIFEQWDDFVENVRAIDPATAPSSPLNRERLGSPSPSPRQAVAVGLNYRAHAAESGFAVPDTLPPTFTKFVSSITGPDTEVELPASGNTDWEAELVVIIGRGGRRIAESEAWSHVAGLAIGQDLSERVTQMQGPAPQFSLGKSFPGFAPIGPWLVTPEEFADPDAISLGCAIDGETVQNGSTRDLIFPISALLAKISEIITLQPGDIVFTGTPEGVGVGRSPQRFLQPGEQLRTWAEGIGELHQRFVAAPSVATAK
ncbi:fumarylacetoacetate hydrolase family protein [Herbiconiux liukaitaii]|uniref:fumarylacetoacetate hydrolase family protein n=1 Tax=Herbiconiux liukaitaii TaxID=3342799 RepID=UPI0035B9BCB5